MNIDTSVLWNVDSIMSKVDLPVPIFMDVHDIPLNGGKNPPTILYSVSSLFKE